MTSVRISTVADAVAYPEDEEKLITVIETLRSFQIPYIVAGRLSNVLFRSTRYKGVIINTAKFTTKYEAEKLVELACGTSLPKIIREMADIGLGGMEGLYGIPGTVGGMVRQNAGAFNYEISDTFLSARCYYPTTGAVKTLEKDDMNFSYRHSVLANTDLILLSAKFLFVPKDKRSIFEEIAEYSHIRRSTQPIGSPSLGSVFKRVGNISAAYYIDRSGMKGLCVGGAKVSEKHAGFIVNNGDATANDYLTLIDIIKEKVLKLYGIELEEEIVII